MERILERIGRGTAGHPWLTITGWLVMVVALLGVAGASGGAFVNEFRIPGAEAQKATDLAQEHFPELGAVSADVVWHATSGTLRDPGKTAAVQQAVQAFGGLTDVRSASDPFADGGASLSSDGRTAISSVQYAKELGELDVLSGEQLEEAAAPARAAGVQVEFRGLVVDLGSQPETSGTELIGVAAALLVLLLAFGSVVAAGLPVVVALTGLAGGVALVLIAGTSIDIPAIAPIIAVMLGLGAGIDYALFVLTRFRQALAAGDDPVTAAGRSLATAGHAVLFAGATVVAAILSLLLVGIPFIGGMGVAAALTVTMTMLSALTLLPALLGLLGHRVNALRVGRRRAVTAGSRHGDAVLDGRWARWAGHVVDHRWLYAAVSVLLLVVLTLPLIGLRLGFPDDGNSPTSFTQRRAYDIVSEQYGPGWNAPLVVVAELGSGGDVQAALGRELAADPEVEVVTPPQVSEDGRVALFTVVPKHAPQDEQVADLLHRIRDEVVPRVTGSGDARVVVGGATALNADLSDAVAQRLPWLVGAVLLAATLLLILMFRAPLVALQAAFMNLLSIGAAFGVLVAVFNWGWGRSLVGVEGDVPIMAMVPMLLFAVLFGLSMDYEVFLLSAVKEDYDRRRDARVAVQAGVGSTARVITAAAAIMIMVFLSFVPINDVSIKMMGLGLAAAVLIDVTIIRMMLAPALLGILGDAGWRGFGRRSAPAPRPADEDEPVPAR